MIWIPISRGCPTQPLLCFLFNHPHPTSFISYQSSASRQPPSLCSLRSVQGPVTFLTHFWTLFLSSLGSWPTPGMIFWAQATVSDWAPDDLVQSSLLWLWPHVLTTWTEQPPLTLTSCSEKLQAHQWPGWAPVPGQSYSYHFPLSVGHGGESWGYVRKFRVNCPWGGEGGIGFKAILGKKKREKGPHHLGSQQKTDRRLTLDQCDYLQRCGQCIRNPLQTCGLPR